MELREDSCIRVYYLYNEIRMDDNLGEILFTMR